LAHDAVGTAGELLQQTNGIIMPSVKEALLAFTCALFIAGCQTQAGNEARRVTVDQNAVVVDFGQGISQRYRLSFQVLYRKDDPRMELRPAGLDRVSYNVPTWLAIDKSRADLKATVRDAATAGDGFDDSILDRSTDARTANYFASGEVIGIEPDEVVRVDDVIHLRFADHALFRLEASIDLGDQYPRLDYTLRPKAEGYYSVGFTGAPQFELREVQEIWQPLIWQEMSFPDKSYLTLAYRAPLPTTMVRAGGVNHALIAHPKEFPFDPLPVAQNSRFGVLLRNAAGRAQPMLFAPVLGGIESKMKAGDQFAFSSYLVAQPGDSISETYESLARRIYGFKDYRRNAIASLNTTLENIVDYSLTKYAWFEDKLKGHAYSTDVPGAVKNVSSLNALELALVTDNRRMFEERAYPTLEYMLSREKFLFSLDPEQKIQNPSRNMFGPIAPISELSALYSILGGANPFFLELARREYGNSRTRNLDNPERGDSWWNALWLYKATGDEAYLAKAISGADEYLRDRVDQPVTAPEGFFWTSFTPRFIDLVELYEVTREPKYLAAARKAARQFTMFTWMSPKIPEQKVIVNEGGKAPMYWYLKSKGHRQMFIDEAAVDAWRLSEIGLTAESSGTSSGHRAIFMANYAPWMLRIGYYADDQFLKDVAKAAIIGRYRNFPGYHINTARTNIYEHESYPLRPHLELSVNSFHYNHVLPMASMLLDYLVTDTFVRSKGAIEFPSQYIEGYAYLQNKFYGHAPGSFYGEQGVRLWMPPKLLEVEDIELNYISGYRGNDLYIAFTNQSDRKVVTGFTLNRALTELSSEYSITRWQENRKTGTEKGRGHSLQVEVAPHGISVVKISGVTPRVGFSDALFGKATAIPNDYLEIEVGNARAMLIGLGDYGRRAYIYLRDDDSKIREATLRYKDAAGIEQTVTDGDFPYEFTVNLPEGATGLRFSLQTRDRAGRVEATRELSLGH
jgi:hypothetical protein